MSGKYYLGIDIGTAMSKVGYVDDSGNQPRADIFRFKNFIGQGLIPSAILYDEKLTPIAFGEKAIEEYELNGQSGYLVREFKVKLGEKINLVDDVYIESETVYRDFLEYIRELLISHIYIESDDVLTDESNPLGSGVICVTHPAQKDDDSYGERVGRLAMQVFGKPDIKIVALNEPAAITQYIDSQSAKPILLMKPKNILVIDSGGGTTDFCWALAKYRWLGSRPPLSILDTGRLDKGGRDIDRIMYQAVEEMLENEVRRNLNQEKLLRTIGEIKNRYDWDSDFVVQVESKTISLSSHVLRRYASPVIDAIVGRAGQFVDEAKKKQSPIQLLILAGGNSRVPMLREALQKNFDDVEIVQVPFEDMQTSAALGAALYGNSKDPVRWRLAYTIQLKYAKGKPQTLWKKDTEVGIENRTKKVVIKYNETDMSPVDILFVDSTGASTTRELVIKFTEPVEPTIMSVQFQIDANGYLRYVVQPYDKQSPEYRHVIRQYVLNTMPAIH
jgi:molecular chaperone DnaK (HSP70)